MLLHNAIIQERALPSLQGGQPQLISLTRDDLSMLFNTLKHAKRSDPYTTSAAYFAITGRKGLWLYGDEQTRMLIARHPNCDDTLLFFPPFGAEPARLMQLALNDPDIPDGKIQIARLGPEDSSLSMQLGAHGLGKPAMETVLDWAYPVHIYSTKKVAEHKGQKFRTLRGHINRALRKGMHAEKLDPWRDAEAMRKTSTLWAENSPDKEETMVPVNIVMDLMRSRILPLHGIKVYDEGQFAGFVVWEETNPTSGLANSIFSASSSGKGVDNFIAYSMCRALSEKGFLEVCDGGSETEGLDAFKRRMRPIRSIQLNTIKNYREAQLEIAA